MIKIYYGDNINNVMWKIYTDHIAFKMYYFTHDSSIFDVIDKVCQFSLFSRNDEQLVYVINATNWDFTNKEIQSNIKILHNVKNEIILAIETNSLKKDCFKYIDVNQIKATQISQKCKMQIIHQLLSTKNIIMPYKVELMFTSMVLNNINYIKNEINKLSLIYTNTLTIDDYKKICFNIGEENIFYIINFWLKNDYEKMVLNLNELLKINYKIIDILPTFVYCLTQLKFFLEAKINNYSSDFIQKKLNMPIWQQLKYSIFQPYTNKLVKINNILLKIYNLEVKIKENKINPYVGFITIILGY